MAHALHGIKVVDVSQVVAVPIAARHLADFGADVIHVENPQTGDSWRSFQAGTPGGNVGVPSDINYCWETYNRNKRGITLDLSQKTGQQILHKLVENADIFITNLRLWEREKFAVEYDTLRQLNPGLIYGSLTGYGKKGPDRNAPAYDHTAAWYRAGMAHMLSGIAGIGFTVGLVDTVAGLALFGGIMTALYMRDKTGVGQEVDLSLLNIGVYQLSFDIAGALVTGVDSKDLVPEQLAEQDEALAKRHQELMYEAEAAINRLRELFRENIPNPLAIDYTTKDERIIHLNVLQPDRYWSRVCQAIDRPDLENDPRFNSYESRIENHLELYHIVREFFSSNTLDELKPLLSKFGIPFAPRQKLSEVINDPQARANDYFVPCDHPTYGRFEVLANPIRLSENPATIRTPAPEFSQHTEEVLLELGYNWEDIAQFKQQKVIA